MARRIPTHPAAQAAELFDAQDDGPAPGTVAPAAQAPAPAPAAQPQAPAAQVAPAVDHSKELDTLRQMVATLESKGSREAELEAELASAREGTTRAQALEAELAAAREELGGFRKQAQGRSIDDMMAGTAIDEDEDGVDSRMVETIRNKVLRPVVERLTQAHQAELGALQNELGKTREQIKATAEDLRGVDATRQRRVTNEGIFKEHPDFLEVQKTAPYEAFIASRIPGSRQSYASAMTEAYKEGDAAYVNSVLSAFKRAVGKDAGVLAEPSGGTGAAAQHSGDDPSQGKRYTYKDLEDARWSVRSGHMSRVELSKFIKEFELAEASGRVS
jgi:hypothetical protein